MFRQRKYQQVVVRVETRASRLLDSQKSSRLFITYGCNQVIGLPRVCPRYVLKRLLYRCQHTSRSKYYCTTKRWVVLSFRAVRVLGIVSVRHGFLSGCLVITLVSTTVVFSPRRRWRNEKLPRIQATNWQARFRFQQAGCENYQRVTMLARTLSLTPSKALEVISNGLNPHDS